jgi:menaquinone-dependent protoporphyrinogen oxidase
LQTTGSKIMRVLVTWASKRGGTASIGRILGEALAARGFDVAPVAVHEVLEVGSFDAVVVGGALYANRWPGQARRFVSRHVHELRKVPVWFFSSGPLDDSADRAEIPATNEVAVLAERVGARGHRTFGGRLEPSAKGFPASAMAKKKSGDWRNPERIRAWAARLADELPSAVPGNPVEPPARSIPRLLAHGVVGWGLGAVLVTALQLVNVGAALVIHAIAAPLIFILIARRYFRARGAREALPTAIVWTAIVALLDLTVVAIFVQRSLEMFESMTGTWLPFALIFAAVWTTGTVLSMLPQTGRTERGA